MKMAMGSAVKFWDPVKMRTPGPYFPGKLGTHAKSNDSRGGGLVTRLLPLPSALKNDIMHSWIRSVNCRHFVTAVINRKSMSTHLLESMIDDLNLPNIAILIQNTHSKSCWNRYSRKILGTRAHLHLVNQAEVKTKLEYLTMCDPNFSTPSPLWGTTHCANHLYLTTWSNFRICLLLSCHGLVRV